MSEMYGARLTLEFVAEMEVRQANPSEEIQRVYNIKPRKYLVIPKTERIFPNEIIELCFPDINSHTPYSSMTGRGLKKIDYRTPDLNQHEVGSLAYVFLWYRFVDVLEQTEEKYNSIQKIRYKPGEFEKILREAKIGFLKQIRKMGLPAELSKVSVTLEGDYK